MGWMDDQLFVTDKDQRPSPALMLSIKNSPHSWVKPLGGLWTSTYTGEETGSAWVQWCLVEEFNLPKDGWHCYLLKPKKDANVYVVDSKEDLKVLLDRFERRDFPGLSLMRAIDFEKMALHYNGLHLTRKGEWETRMDIRDNLYGWDVESTLWFRWVFEEVEDLGIRTFQLKETG